MKSSRYMYIERPIVWPVYVGAMYLCVTVNRESGDSPVTTTCSSVACFQDYVLRLGTSERTECPCRLMRTVWRDAHPIPGPQSTCLNPLGGINVCCFGFYGQDSDDFPVTPIWYVSRLISQVSRASP